jgi:tetratricopeptide (TPR) repeat protein
MRDEAAEVHERAFNRALALIPKGYKGQITWSEIENASSGSETNPATVAEGHPDLFQRDSGRQDRASYNRSFLRLAHGTLLGLMHRREGKSAMVLAKKLLAWCPMDNLGVRFLLGDIALITGDRKAAMKEYLNGSPNSPAHWYQAALIAFREGDYVAACTCLRRGIAANPYIAEGLAGRTLIAEHLYWHASNVHGPEWAVDYLESAACDWTAEEIDFVDWVFNASPVLRERADLMELHEGLTYERDDEKRGSFAWRSTRFIEGITDEVSETMVKKIRNRYGVEVWPWERASIR